jgi:hypothetical protein
MGYSPPRMGGVMRDFTLSEMITAFACGMLAAALVLL